MSTNGRLRIGIVGCGVIANAHLPYVRSAGGEPVALCDLDIAASGELADRHGIQRVYRHVGDMLDCEKLDAIHVLTPPHVHAAVAVAALERGIPALVEKPLALTDADVQAMADAARRGGTFFTAGHNRLFDPPMLVAKQLWESGELGELIAIESYQAGMASERQWLGELAGGGIGDLVPHPLYLQLHFLGAVERLEAVAFSPRRENGPERSGGTDSPASGRGHGTDAPTGRGHGTDAPTGRGHGTDAPTGRIEELRVLMQGEGRTGFLTISMNASPMMNTLKLCGSKMTVEVNLNNMTIVRRRDYKVPKIIAKPLPNLDESWQLLTQTTRNTVDFVRGKIRFYPGMGELIRRFYDSIRNGTPPPVSEDDAAQVVAVTNRIWAAVDASAGGRVPAKAPARRTRAKASRSGVAVADLAERTAVPAADASPADGLADAALADSSAGTPAATTGEDRGSLAGDDGTTPRGVDGARAASGDN